MDGNGGGQFCHRQQWEVDREVMDSNGGGQFCHRQQWQVDKEATDSDGRWSGR